MNNSRELLLHLSLIQDIGPSTISKLCAAEYGADGICLYELSATDFVARYHLSPETAQKIATGLADHALLEKELDLMERYAISWICIVDPEYPQLLKNIQAPPAILYYKGALPTRPNALAIVGSRDANAYAQRAVEQIVPSLIAHDWIIVSGGARGADTMAHQAALAAQGKTIAVLGSGLLRPYPPTNLRLFDEIVASGGALISSFPVLMDPLPINFPARNRIIAGLSRGCLVVQAAQKSGARITAEYCLTQGRDVFAIPGSIDDPLSAGCHILIQQGAKLTTGPQDILGEYGYDIPTQKVKKWADEEEQLKIMPAQSSAFTPEENILAFCKKPCSLDELLEHTQIPLIELSRYLFDLQLKGQIMQNMSGLWETSY